MSALIYCIQPDQVMVATDTLAVSDEVGNPGKWITKCFPLLHLRLLVAGTGLGVFADRWALLINQQCVTRDVDDLILAAPALLSALWREHEVQARNENFTTTVFHFGFSESDQCMKGFIHRSKNNFQAESIGYGFGAKPDFDKSIIQGLPRDFIPAMEDQRMRQSRLEPENRVHIGGEMHLFHLTDSKIDCSVIHRFEDFDAMDAEIQENYWRGRG